MVLGRDGDGGRSQRLEQAVVRHHAVLLHRDGVVALRELGEGPPLHAQLNENTRIVFLNSVDKLNETHGLFICEFTLKSVCVCLITGCIRH